MKPLLYAGAIYHLAFALFHLAFWRLFRWREDLARLGAINRGVMQILNLRLTFVFLLFAWVSFFHADAMLDSALGQALMIGIALFWLLRAIEQVIFFGLRQPLSAALFVVFLGGACLYTVPLLGDSA